MKKILVVEDDKLISAVLTIRLEAAGYEVCTAYDAALAMTRAMAEQPDLALLDISMPGGNGFIVAERLRSNEATAGIPFIFLTALKKPGLLEKAVEMGAAAFFEKPYESDELIAAIERTLTSTTVS